MKIPYINWIQATLLLIILSACSQKIVLLNPDKLERKKTQELVDALDEMILHRPDYFYSRISTKFKDTTQNVSFKTSLKIKKDSAVSAFISFAAIPIIQSIVTKDTLTVVDKRNKCYKKADLSLIKSTFGFAFEYANVEELLLGIPLAYDTNQRYFQIHDPFNYVISSHRKRQIKKNDKGKAIDKNKDNDDDIIIKYYLSDDITRIKKLVIDSPSDSTKLEINYVTSEIINSFNVPKNVEIQVITARNKINLKLDYEKTEVNEPQSLLLVIPKTYGICE
ncbi:MAG: DUF4292 domain-containing protein [Crocinitomicaceae bacterium]|nr:DUF4292 domain-containing protein [Crocinitomicaceae bacterium]